MHLLFCSLPANCKAELLVLLVVALESELLVEPDLPYELASRWLQPFIFACFEVAVRLLVALDDQQPIFLQMPGQALDRLDCIAVLQVFEGPVAEDQLEALTSLWSVLPEI